MKILHRMLLRMLPGPFLGALGTLMFLLLMQFLMKHLPDLVGKGLPVRVILELITYNLAYMLVLAVPMSVLLAVIAAFARLADSGTHVVIKGAGISLPRLMWPVAVCGGLMMLVMGYFNNVTLPEANHKARDLWQDIRRKQPDFLLQPGVFYDGLRGYSLRAMRIPADSDELFDVTVFDYSEGNRVQTTVSAKRGRLTTSPDGRKLNLELYDGELHRSQQTMHLAGAADRYERMHFKRYRTQLDLSDLDFERSEPGRSSRTDRTMRTSAMMHFVDSLEADIARRRHDVRLVMDRLGATHPDTTRRLFETDPLPLPTLADTTASDPNDTRFTLSALDTLVRNEIYDLALQNARSVQADIENATTSINWAMQRADRYRVEIHKKFSIAFACLVFVLIGAPLVLLIQRGSLTVVTALSAAIFIFYWVTLVLGEKLADRGALEPWVGMWAANIVIGTAAVLLLIRAYRGPRRWWKRP